MTLKVKQVDWVGYKNYKCPNCKKTIYLDTQELKDKAIIKCQNCKHGILIKYEL